MEDHGTVQAAAMGVASRLTPHTVRVFTAHNSAAVSTQRRRGGGVQAAMSRRTK